MSDNNKNSFSGRVKRYAKVSASVGGVAARFASDKLIGRDHDAVKGARDLKDALGGLKGPLMKVAQIMATIPDALPKEYAQELAQLQSNAPSMGWVFVKRRMAGELGPDWRTKFESFSKTAAAAASLGQVHKATDLDGNALACKLQYPDMASAVEADLKQLGLIFSIYRRYDNSIDPSQIKEEIGARLREELDYALEGQHMNLYGVMLGAEEQVTVPHFYPALSTDRLLTMNWLEGMPLLAFKQADQAVRNQIALSLFRAWYVPFYSYGVIHGDPHLGNYAVRDDYGLNLWDFGCVRVFPPSFVGGVIDLYRALERGDRALAVKAYETWGFSNLSNDVIDTLNLWASFVYGPLLEDRTRLIHEDVDNAGQYGRDVAAQVHKKLKQAGGVTIPREFVFMDRAAIGLGGVFLHLRAEINWHRLFHDLIEDFDLATLAARQREALAKVDLIDRHASVLDSGRPLAS